MSKLVERGAVILGASWLVESLLNIGQMIYGWLP